MSAITKRIRGSLYVGVALALAVGIASRPAHAIPLGFSCVAGGNSASCAVGQAQFVVEVVDAGPDGVAFIVSNEGPRESAIARIYMEDDRDTLRGPAVIHQDAPAVMFSDGVTPRDLPGGSSVEPAFVAAPGLGVAASSPHRQLGVNPGEHIALVYPLSAGNTFGDVISDLVTGDLRVGIHVAGLRLRGNESFISQRLMTETPE